MQALLFLDSSREYAAAVVFLFAICFVLFVLAAIGAYRLTTRQSKRYPVPPRQTPRAEPIDLAKERYEFESRRDAYAEERLLRRVG